MVLFKMKKNELDESVLDLYRAVTGDSNATYEDIRKKFAKTKLTEPFHRIPEEISRGKFLLEDDLDEESFEL